MKSNEYSVMYDLEENHWWFKGKRKIVFSQFEVYFNKKNLKILDIGCGTGIMMKNLERYGMVFGLDINSNSLKYCKQRGLNNLVRGTINNLPFKSEKFDIVGIFDVLYHRAVKNDVNALREINRVLRNGGILLITDSADMKLWGRHDKAVHARERYTVPIYSERLKSANFTIIKITYFNTLLYPLVYFFRKIDNVLNKDVTTKSNIEKTTSILNSILYSILALESFLIRYLNMPFGVSIFVIAKKHL